MAQASWERVVTELVAERGDALLRYAILLTGSADDAADLVQDALVRTFGRLRNGFTVASAESYVRRAILNASLDRGRRVSRWRKVAPTQYVPEELPATDEATGLRLDLHEELRKLTQSIRPDWDLSQPDLRRQWDAGDKARFYPYGVKSMEQTLKEMAGAVDQYAGAAWER